MPVSTPWESIKEELSSQMTYHSSIMPIVGTHFAHEWGEEMHIKSLSQGLNVYLAQPGPPDPEAKCLPLEHNTIMITRTMR